MSDFKYILDEHVGIRLQRGMRRHWPDIVVWRIGDPGAPAFGTKDPEILEWCFRRKFVLVTNNRASMPVHLTARLAEGNVVAGIFILNARLKLSETIEDLAVVWATSRFEDHLNLIRYLPVSNRVY